MAVAAIALKRTFPIILSGNRALTLSGITATPLGNAKDCLLPRSGERFDDVGRWSFGWGWLRRWDGRFNRPIGPRLALQVVTRAMQVAIELFASLAKFIHALTQASRQFRQFFGAEEYKHNHENNNQIGAAKVSEAECERMHINHLG
jgi:hypothetical protein